MHYTVQHYAFLYYLKLVPQETKHVINSLYYDVLMDSAKAGHILSHTTIGYSNTNQNQ